MVLTSNRHFYVSRHKRKFFFKKHTVLLIFSILILFVIALLKTDIIAKNSIKYCLNSKKDAFLESPKKSPILPIFGSAASLNPKFIGLIWIHMYNPYLRGFIGYESYMRQINNQSIYTMSQTKIWAKIGPF